MVSHNSTREELYNKAKKIGLKNVSKFNRQQLYEVIKKNEFKIEDIDNILKKLYFVFFGLKNFKNNYCKEFDLNIIKCCINIFEQIYIDFYNYKNGFKFICYPYIFTEDFTTIETYENIKLLNLISELIFNFTHLLLPDIICNYTEDIKNINTYLKKIYHELICYNKYRFDF